MQYSFVKRRIANGRFRDRPRCLARIATIQNDDNNCFFAEDPMETFSPSLLRDCSLLSRKTFEAGHGVSHRAQSQVLRPEQEEKATSYL